MEYYSAINKRRKPYLLLFMKEKETAWMDLDSTMLNVSYLIRAYASPIIGEYPLCLPVLPTLHSCSYWVKLRPVGG